MVTTAEAPEIGRPGRFSLRTLQADGREDVCLAAWKGELPTILPAVVFNTIVKTVWHIMLLKQNTQVQRKGMGHTGDIRRMQRGNQIGKDEMIIRGLFAWSPVVNGVDCAYVIVVLIFGVFIR